MPKVASDLERFVITIDNNAFLTSDDLSYQSRAVKEPIIWDFYHDLESFNHIFFRNSNGSMRVIQCPQLSRTQCDVWVNSIDEIEKLIGLSITWPWSWISFEGDQNNLSQGPIRQPGMGHVCEFIDPGIGRFEWCKHNGCSIERDKFFRYK